MLLAGLKLGVTLLAALGLVTAALAQAADSKTEKLDSGQINNEPLRGLVINRTITVLGWDFYKDFSDTWRALYPNSEDTLTIVERPTAQFGSEIWVNYLDRQVFHIFLPPARSNVRQVSKQAVEIVQNNIARIDIQRKLFTDDDLGPEEM